jgi:hypothetical protein
LFISAFILAIAMLFRNTWQKTASEISFANEIAIQPLPVPISRTLSF